MKVRNGFVSNSSSSSFVVISKNPETVMKEIPEDLFIKQACEWAPETVRFSISFPKVSGELHFGWQFERYYDFISKCNYAVAQFMGLDRDLRYKYEKMFEKVLRKHVDHKGYTEVVYDYNYFHYNSILDEDCYVDHQSSYREYVESAHTIFKSEEVLENFLFNEQSFIQCGNDNEDPTPEWIEARKMKGSEYNPD